MLMNFVDVFVGTYVLFRFNDFVIIIFHWKRKINETIQNEENFIRFKKILVFLSKFLTFDNNYHIGFY